MYNIGNECHPLSFISNLYSITLIKQGMFILFPLRLIFTQEWSICSGRFHVIFATASFSQQCIFSIFSHEQSDYSFYLTVQFSHLHRGMVISFSSLLLIDFQMFRIFFFFFWSLQMMLLEKLYLYLCCVNSFQA